MALVMQRLLSRRSMANDGELTSASSGLLPLATSSWCVLACSANTGEIGSDISEEFLGKKVLESSCSPEVFDPNTRSELLQALGDDSATPPGSKAKATGTTSTESSDTGGLGLEGSPSAVQVHTMGDSLAVIAPAKYVTSGGKSNSEPREISRLLRDLAVEGSGAASTSREQVAVEKARALTGYDRVLYCRCLALPAFEFDVVEVLAESASEEFRSQSAAASMVGQTALLREIVDGVIVVEGESRSGGSLLSGKLVVPVFRRLPFQPLSLEGLLICHRYGFPSSQSTVMSREARMALDFLAASLSANPDDEYLWYASRAINGSFRVLRKCVRPDSVSLLVKFSGHSWQGEAWGTADVQPGKPVTFADVLVEAYNSASAALKELMQKDSAALSPSSVLHQSAPVIRLDVRSEAPEPAKTPSHPYTVPLMRKLTSLPGRLGHRHISDIKVLKQVVTSSSVSLMIEGRSQSLTAKAWGTAHFCKSQDRDDAYLEAYDKAAATLKELFPPRSVTFNFADELAAVFASTSAPEVSLLDVPMAARRSTADSGESDISVFASLPAISLEPMMDIPETVAERSSDDGVVFDFPSEAEERFESMSSSKRPATSLSMPAPTTSNGFDPAEWERSCKAVDRRGIHNGAIAAIPSEVTAGEDENDDSSHNRCRMDMGALRRSQHRKNSMTIFRNLVKQLRDCPKKPSIEPAETQPAAPAVAQSEGPSPKALDKVLVVDDDLVNVKMIQRVLVKKGLQVTGKEDGQDVIDLCITNGQRFDMILVDENMRHMNGSTAIEHLRHYEKTMGLQPTPVIVTTANTSSQDLTRYNECGMDGVLAKPINMRKLPMSLEAYVMHLQANEGGLAPHPTETLQSKPETCCNTTPGLRMFHEIALLGV